MFLKKHPRLLLGSVLGGASLYIIFIGIGMILYPGGSQVDPNSVGYTFFENSLSDIGRTIALNGEPNLAAMICFFIGTTAFALSLFTFACTFGNMDSTTKAGKRFGHVANGFGILASVSTLVYTYAPTDSMHAAHMVAVYFAYISTFLFTLLFGVQCVFERKKSKSRKWGMESTIFFTFAGLYLISLIILVQSITPIMNQVMQKFGRTLMLVVIITLSIMEWRNTENNLKNVN
ncbi:MAG: hypothetical protein ACTSYI_07305 [Promethearchaeota archaeon]